MFFTMLVSASFVSAFNTKLFLGKKKYSSISFSKQFDASSLVKIGLIFSLLPAPFVLEFNVSPQHYIANADSTGKVFHK